MADAASTDEPISELVGRTEEAAAAWMRGDKDRYLALTHHARGFTLCIATPTRWSTAST
jgi:hypothetical protein